MNMLQRIGSGIAFIFLFLLLALSNCSSEKIEPNRVQTGLDRVVADNFSGFKGKNLGIVCNHTSRDKTGEHIVDLFHKNKSCSVRAIFAPEHGFRGKEAAGSSIEDDMDPRTGIKIYSLYGDTKKPTEKMLENIDMLIYDIQDIGARFYTYISTMTYCMEAAAENDIPIAVFDRPNPIRGNIVEGPILQEDYQSFVGLHPIPIRYGLTPGELAILINKSGYLKNKIKADLSVIKLKGWKRSLWYDQTDLPWIAPSPNIPDLETALVYPGMCLLEGTNLSEGRGTDTPFLLFGAPWISSDTLVSKLNRMDFEGIKFQGQNFKPVDIPGQAHNPKYENQECRGIRLQITDRETYRPVKTAVKILATINNNYPENFQWRKRWIDLLTGSDDLRKNFKNNAAVESLLQDWQTQAQAFEKLSKKYYLY
jgi:uncharacterized protein YbbC (DUF1343 family)